MNPDFSLSDWMKNWGTLIQATDSTSNWRSFRDANHQLDHAEGKLDTTQNTA
jgi:hypothetical protein